jgi:hypothetical protein
MAKEGFRDGAGPQSNITMVDELIAQKQAFAALCAQIPR